MQLKRLEFNLEKAKIQYALAQLNIEKNVTAAFYGVYQSYKRLVTAREAFQSQKENHELIKNKVEQGLIPKKSFSGGGDLGHKREFSCRHGNELREHQRSIQTNFGFTS